MDSLDTLLLLGFNDEAAKAQALIVDKLSFDKDISVKNFEVTIRLLGGLLSGYQMTGDARLLHLAEDLGTRLLPVFNSPTGMPYMFVNLKTGKTSGARSNPAEIGTLLLEFGTLAKLTNKPVFYDKAKNAARPALQAALEDRPRRRGDRRRDRRWTSQASHVGGGIDSYYEYLLKCSRLFGDKDCASDVAGEHPRPRTSIWPTSRRRASGTARWTWTTGKRTATEFGALHAFLPAVLALGGDLGRARRLQDSCLQDVEPARDRARGDRLPDDEDHAPPATRCGPRSSSRPTTSTTTRRTRATCAMGRDLLRRARRRTAAPTPATRCSRDVTTRRRAT